MANIGSEQKVMHAKVQHPFSSYINKRLYVGDVFKSRTRGYGRPFSECFGLQILPSHQSFRGHRFLCDLRHYSESYERCNDRINKRVARFGSKEKLKKNKLDQNYLALIPSTRARTSFRQAQNSNEDTASLYSRLWMLNHCSISLFPVVVSVIWQLYIIFVA